MRRTANAKSVRLGALALLVAFLLGGFDADARQTGEPLAGATGGTNAEAESEHPTTTTTTLSIATDVPYRGLVYEGLKPVNNRKSRCRGAYHGRTYDGKKICTHGPDAAPQGVDVRRPRTTRALEATTSTSATDASGSSSLPCYADGISGPRVQAVYARASDVPDRSASVVPLIPEWAARVDAAFDVSAVQTGGRRHVRWVTGPGCSLTVETVTLSPAGDDTLTAMINELKAQGYNRTDRKYLVWTDATRYCGIAEIKSDDQAGPANAHNFGPMFGRVDAACWGLANSTEAHELMHMLGGIQLSAPHSTGGWHCTDENDRMCLAEMGMTLSFECATTNEQLFDCGHDDYYNTAPAPGSYLATHWNAANNVFLSGAVPDSCVTTAQASETTRRRRGRKRNRHRAVTGPVPAPAGPCVPQ